MICSNCGMRLPDNAAFCGNCGTPLSAPANPAPAPAPAIAQAAPQQAPVPPQAYQPYHQGTYQQQPAGQPQQPYQQPYQQAAQAPYQQPAQAVPARSKSKIAAGLLAIFLGALGVHKFYLGYTKAAVIMLLVTLLGSILAGLGPAVMLVIGIIEGIMYLVKSDQEFYNIYVLGEKQWF